MNAQPKLIQFAKMHGLGNDFVLINNLQRTLDKTIPIKTLSDRHLGIGFDQLLIIEPSHKADFFCHIYNADGSEALQCGNGLRCVARYLHEQKIRGKTSLHIETKAGIYLLTINDYEHIHMNMGVPSIQEKEITLASPDALKKISMSILSLGNLHAILKVANIELTPPTLAPTIASHPYFPQGVNVGLMQIMNDHTISLKTYERGSGETFACGSNACAAVVAGILNGWLTNKVTVNTGYGSLEIEWQGGSLDSVQMIGPATLVFMGEIVL